MNVTSKNVTKKKWNFKRMIVIIVFVSMFTFFLWFENHHLVVHHFEIEDTHITKQVGELRIVQISDLHNASFGKNNGKLIEKIKEQKPDVMVLTGDLVDSNHTNLKIALEFAEAVTQICPVYYITGNHEYWLSEKEREQLFSGLQKCGVIILSNEIATIHTKDMEWDFVGLDDRSLFDHTLQNLIAASDSSKLQIVLAHEPQYFSDYSISGAQLVLAGHAHGGQVILPFVGPMVAPDQGFFPKYAEGEYQEGKTKMIVSRGLGNSVIPFRLFNDPEIVVVTLKEKK